MLENTSTITHQPMDYMQEKRPRLSLRHPLTILLVDDQPEAINPLKVILANYDCKLVTITSSFEARIQQYLNQADVIVLDWNLGETTGLKVIENCTRWISQFSSLDLRLRRSKTKLITLTGENARPQFSMNTQKYFAHIDHWSKNLDFFRLKTQTLNTLNFCRL